MMNDILTHTLLWVQLTGENRSSDKLEGQTYSDRNAPWVLGWKV